MPSVKLPNLDEAIERLNQLMEKAFAIDHPVMLDWIVVRFALNGGDLSELCPLTGNKHRWSPSGECYDCSAFVEDSYRKVLKLRWMHR